jgi:hypothetical protein
VNLVADNPKNQANTHVRVYLHDTISFYPKTIFRCVYQKRCEKKARNANTINFGFDTNLHEFQAKILKIRAIRVK